MIVEGNKAIEVAIRWALDAHANQEDKSGEAYILHPLSLMAKMETTNEKIVALLHDTVEDSVGSSHAVTLDMILTWFGEEIMLAVDALTRREPPLKYPLYRTFNGQTSLGYDFVIPEKQEVYLTEYIPRLKDNAIARKVKIADIHHNLTPTRLTNLNDDELGRVRRYIKALILLTR